jgi:site-specific recombinase XerD
MDAQIVQYESKSLTVPQTMSDLITGWTEHLSRKVKAGAISQDTANGYTRGMNKFATWLGEKHPDGDVILEWIGCLREQSNTPSTVNAWLAGVRSFFEWATTTNQIPFNPTQAIKGITRKGTKKRHARESLTDSEARRVLSQPNRETPEGIRDYAMLATMLYTAARGIELHRADLSDLQTMNGKLVLYVQGKGHIEKDEMLVITGEAESAMRSWLATRGKQNGALFISLSNRSKGERLSRRALRDIIKGYFDKAGVHGNKTTHSLRHTAITSAIRHGAPAEKVRGMSRHASLDTLMIYYHEADRIDNPAEQYISYGE